MPYPGVGTWAFRNVTEGFDFWPLLESIVISDSHPHDTATFSCEVVDKNNALVFNNDDRITVTFDGTRLFAGTVKRRGRGQRSEVGPRAFVLECQDYTAELDDSIITRKKDRKKETIRKRLKWIYASLNFNCNLDLSGVPSDETADRANYHGMSTLDAFENVADENNLFMQMDFDDDADGVPTLSFFRNITDVASFDLDNEAPDYSSTFPYREFIDWDDSMQLATMVYVIPKNEKEAKWVTNETKRALYGWKQASVMDSSIRGDGGIERIGGRFLDEFDQPLTEGFAVVHQPGLRSGQRIQIVNALWGLDYTRYITAVTTTAVEPHDENDEAHLRAEVQFNDRRKTRRRTSRPLDGDIAVPTDPQTVTFNPTTPPTQSDGDPITLTRAGRMRHGRNNVDVSIYYEPTWTDYVSGLDMWVRSHIDGYIAWSWPTKPAWSECGGLDNHLSGFTEQEPWWKVLMPAIPAGAAGVEFDMPISTSVGGTQGPSYAEVAPVDIVASATKPTTMQQGTLIGQGYKGQTVTVTIPAELLPVEGDYLYVGYRPGWHTTGAADPYAHACGWSWPFMSDSYELDIDGVQYMGHSGRIGVGADSIVGKWLVWDGAAPDLGSTPAGNTINDAGYTGDPTAWVVDATGKLAVVADEPSAKGVYIAGYRENEEPEGPWSDGQWAARVHFIATGTGSTSDAGTREIRLTTTSQGEQSVGVVHMGDANRAEGISVSGAAATDYQAQALTEGVEMIAMFDTRNSDVVRGKMWVASEGEPTEWAVFADIGETEDDQDRFTLWLRGGNDGTEQGVTGVWIEGIEGASPGQHIINEFIGYASGYEKTFYVPNRFEEGALKVFVNGKLTKPISEDGQGASFQLDWWPTRGSSIVLDYIAAGVDDDG